MAALRQLVLMAQADGSPFQFLEEHSHIIYPALGAVVLLLLAASVFSAWKTPEVTGAEKAQTKGEIIRLMRKNIGWITATEVSENLGIETHTAASLLLEMKNDGLLTSATLQGLLHYRLKM